MPVRHNPPGSQGEHSSDAEADRDAGHHNDCSGRRVHSHAVLGGQRCGAWLKRDILQLEAGQALAVLHTAALVGAWQGRMAWQLDVQVALSAPPPPTWYWNTEAATNT